MCDIQHLQVVGTWKKYSNDKWVLGTSVLNTSTTLTLHEFEYLAVRGSSKYTPEIRLTKLRCKMKLYVYAQSAELGLDPGGLTEGGGLGPDRFEDGAWRLSTGLPPNTAGHLISVVDVKSDDLYLVYIMFEERINYIVTGDPMKHQVSFLFDIFVSGCRSDMDTVKPFYVRKDEVNKSQHGDTADASDYSGDFPLAMPSPTNSATKPHSETMTSAGQLDPVIMESSESESDFLLMTPPEISHGLVSTTARGDKSTCNSKETAVNVDSSSKLLLKLPGLDPNLPSTSTNVGFVATEPSYSLWNMYTKYVYQTSAVRPLKKTGVTSRLSLYSDGDKKNTDQPSMLDKEGGSEKLEEICSGKRKYDEIANDAGGEKQTSLEEQENGLNQNDDIVSGGSDHQSSANHSGLTENLTAETLDPSDGLSPGLYSPEPPGILRQRRHDKWKSRCEVDHSSDEELSDVVERMESSDDDNYLEDEWNHEPMNYRDRTQTVAHLICDSFIGQHEELKEFTHNFLAVVATSVVAQFRITSSRPSRPIQSLLLNKLKFEYIPNTTFKSVFFHQADASDYNSLAGMMIVVKRRAHGSPSIIEYDITTYSNDDKQVCTVTDAIHSHSEMSMSFEPEPDVEDVPNGYDPLREEQRHVYDSAVKWQEGGGPISREDSYSKFRKRLSELELQTDKFVLLHLKPESK